MVVCLLPVFEAALSAAFFVWVMLITLADTNEYFGIIPCRGTATN
jgi:hypothetical protein